jgi:hypothetical protein
VCPLFLDHCASTAPRSDQTWRLNKPTQRTCEHPRRLYRYALSLMTNPSSLSRSCGPPLHLRLTPLTFGHRTEIILQDVLNREYTLRLFVENEERKLLTKDNRTWTPAQRPYVPCFPTRCAYGRPFICREISPTSKIRAEIRMKSCYLLWATYRQRSEVIDVQALFNDYWGSKKHEFTVPSQS